MSDKEYLSEAARAERNRYYREYRAKHPEKMREKNRRYWERQAEKRAAEKEDNKSGKQ